MTGQEGDVFRIVPFFQEVLAAQHLCLLAPDEVAAVPSDDGSDVAPPEGDEYDRGLVRTAAPLLSYLLSYLREIWGRTVFR